MLSITTLDGLRIEWQGIPVTDLITRKAEALRVYLACTPRQHPRQLPSLELHQHAGRL